MYTFESQVMLLHKYPMGKTVIPTAQSATANDRTNQLAEECRRRLLVMKTTTKPFPRTVKMESNQPRKLNHTSIAKSRNRSVKSAVARYLSALWRDFSKGRKGLDDSSTCSRKLELQAFPVEVICRQEFTLTIITRLYFLPLRLCLLKCFTFKSLVTFR